LTCDWLESKADGADVTEDDYRRLMAVNFDGVLFSAQAANQSNIMNRYFRPMQIEAGILTEIIQIKPNGKS
jgi:NAD(P)-dependent dehydrogenase (short-subunit alcohol dehydrogenase family)